MVLILIPILVTQPQYSYGISGVISDEESCEDKGGLWEDNPSMLRGGLVAICTIDILRIDSGETLLTGSGIALAIEDTLDNRGALGVEYSIYLHGTLDNRGSITTGGITNDGIINNFPGGGIEGGRILNNAGNRIINNGTISADDIYNDVFDIAIGTIYNGGHLETRREFNTFGDITNRGEMTIASGHMIAAYGFIDNYGTITIAGSSTLVNEADFYNAEVIVNNGEFYTEDGGYATGAIGFLTNNGTIQNNNKFGVSNGGFENFGTLNNNGTLILKGEIKKLGSINNACGATMETEIAVIGPIQDSCDISVLTLAGTIQMAKYSEWNDEEIPVSMAINPETNIGYLGSGNWNQSNKSALYVIDLEKNILIKRIELASQPDYVAIDPEANLIFVLVEHRNTRASLYVVDSASNNIIDTYSTSSAVSSNVIYSESEIKYVWTGDDIQVRDLKDNSLIKTLSMSGSASAAVGNKLYTAEGGTVWWTPVVVDRDSDNREQIWVFGDKIMTFPRSASFDQSSEMEAELKKAGAVGLISDFTFNPSSNELYAAVPFFFNFSSSEDGTLEPTGLSRGSGPIYVYDPNTNQTSGFIKTNIYPYAVEVNPLTSRIYAISIPIPDEFDPSFTERNTIASFDVQTHSPVGFVRLPDEPRSIAVNSKTGTVYVIMPNSDTIAVLYDPVPENKPFEIVDYMITDNFMEEFADGGFLGALSHAKRAFFYVDSKVELEISNSDQIVDVKPILLYDNSAALTFAPDVISEAKKFDSDRWQIDIKVSGFAQEIGFAAIIKQLGALAGLPSSPSVPIEWLSLKTKPAVFISGIVVVDKEGKEHQIEITDENRLPIFIDFLNGGIYNEGGYAGQYFIAYSPVNLLVTDESGKRTGAVQKSDGSFAEVNQIDGAFYTGTIEHGQFVYVPDADGIYDVEAVGTSNGNYTLEWMKMEAGSGEIDSYEGSISLGRTHNFATSEDGSVIFVSETETTPEQETPFPSKCVIATAAFGTELSPQVQFLRDFRDQRILSTLAGSSFMNVFNSWYYSFSPQVADYEREQPWLQQSVKAAIYPLLAILSVSERAYSSLPGEFGAVSAGIIASSMIGGLYFWPFAIPFAKKIRVSKTSYLLAALVASSAIVAVVVAVHIGNATALMTTTSMLVVSVAGISAILSARGITDLWTRYSWKRTR